MTMTIYDTKKPKRIFFLDPKRDRVTIDICDNEAAEEDPKSENGFFIYLRRKTTKTYENNIFLRFLVFENLQ